MKIRNLLVLAIIGATAALFVPAQESDGSMTFTDQFGQSITISRFGTVLSFKDRKGRVSQPGNNFRICASGDDSQCINSGKADGSSASLKGKFPEPGEVLAKGQMVDVTATVQRGVLTVTRRVTWWPGTTVVKLDETLSASSATVVDVIEESAGPNGLRPPCPPPAEPNYKCPPELRDAFASTSGKFELAKQLPISPEKPIRLVFTADLATIPPTSQRKAARKTN